MTEPKVLFFQGDSERFSDEQKKTVEEALRRLESAVETIRIGITISDTDGKILYTNPVEAEIHGYERDELIGKDARIFGPCEVWNPIKKDRIREMTSWKREGINVRKDGSVFPVELISEVLKGPDGEIIGIVTACEDITDRKEKERILARQAMYDALTGLTNRTLFLDRLEHAHKQQKRSKESFAVLFLDLDHFKTINDKYGHLTGDHVLVAMAERLNSSVRPGDTVARLGGDEFAVLLDHVRNQKEAINISQRIQANLNRPLMIGEREISITASIGIALQVEEYSNVEHVLRQADAAMYRAKARGKNGYQVFNGIMLSVPADTHQNAPYEVVCYRCSRPYNAISTRWCKCISLERTFVCPFCQNCFCKASLQYKETFWSTAPEVLWERKANEHRISLPVKSPPEVWQVKRPLVLIVDHNRQVQLSTARLIEELGYGTVLARDGHEAMNFANRYLPQLIFTDQLLPKKDGHELCRRVKENLATADIKVIIKISTFSSSKMRREVFSLSQADEYVRMPISFSEMRSLLTRFLE